MQGVPIQFSESHLVMVPSFGPKLGNILLSFVREIRLPVHVLSSMEAECHQSVSHSDGKVRDDKRIYEAVRGCPPSIGCRDHGHGLVISLKLIYF